MLDELHTLLYKRMAEEQLLALLDSPTPLEDVVRCVYRVETNEMDVIMDCIEILANDRLRQRDTANRRN